MRFTVVYKPGKNNIADPLSRLCQIKLNTPFERCDQVNKIVAYVRPVAVSLKEIQEASKSDNKILKIKEGLLNGIWDESIKRYRVFEVEFCFCENIFLRGDRIVIPSKLRQRVLGAAHEGHRGI